MTLYRMIACDNNSMWQAQYALSSHQEDVKKEPWFLAFIMEHLARQILEKMEEIDEYLLVRNIEWTGWTEVWKFAGEMEWDDED